METGDSSHVLEYDPSFVIYGGGVSFVANIVLFRLISPLISKCLSAGYSDLSKHERMEWNDRFISNVNAGVSILISSYTLFYETSMSHNKVWHDSYGARLGCAIIVGYMLADVVCMLIWCKVSRSDMAGFVFHHAATVYAYYFISAYGVLCYFGMLRLIAEMSTPPVNQRWFFDILNYPRSRIVVILNGFMMLVTFFVFRMVTLPIYWYQIWQVSGTTEVTQLGHIQLIMYLPTFVLDVLNLLWFYKICKGFIKALLGLRHSSVSNIKFKSV